LCVDWRGYELSLIDHLGLRASCYRLATREAKVIEGNYFSGELLAQMARATKRGAKHILINAYQLHCALGDVPGADHASVACCDAMEHEIGNSDQVVVRKDNGAGLTIRYLLPRA
jgi:hypothetical protein